MGHIVIDRTADPQRDGGEPRSGNDAHGHARTGSAGTTREASGRAFSQQRDGEPYAVPTRDVERRRAAIEGSDGGRLTDGAAWTVGPPTHATSAPDTSTTDASAKGDDLRSGHKRRGGKRRRRRGKARTAARIEENKGAQQFEEGAAGRSAADPTAPATVVSETDADRLAQSDFAHAHDRPPGKHPPVRPRTGWRSPHARNSGPLYAALDLGTNNCRLLIATPGRRGQFRVVDAFSRIVKLGEGLGATEALDDAAMDRAVEALKACAGKMEGRKIRRRRLIATEACRRATNGDEFISRVRSEAGLPLEIIDRRTEARLAVAGCASLVDRRARGVVLFDIGGGSTEIALLDMSDGTNRPPERSIVGWTSLPVGVVTLSERYAGQEITPDLFARMVDDVAAMLNAFGDRNRLKRHSRHRYFHLLGTSGTVTTLAGIHLALPRYDRRRVDGLWMNADEIDTVQDRLIHSTYAERRANPCIGTDRADFVLAGSAILEAIRREWPAERLRVADRGLREGMLSDMMVSDNAWALARRSGGRAH